MALGQSQLHSVVGGGGMAEGPGAAEDCGLFGLMCTLWEVN